MPHIVRPDYEALAEEEEPAAGAGNVIAINAERTVVEVLEEALASARAGTTRGVVVLETHGDGLHWRKAADPADYFALIGLLRVVEARIISELTPD